MAIGVAEGIRAGVWIDGGRELKELGSEEWKRERREAWSK